MNYIKEKNILDLKENFRIPIYQRQYAWGKDEVEQLLIDLKQFQKSKKQEYFLGNIVITQNGDFLDVIDGQQRLTTLYLLLKYLNKNPFNLAYEIREKEKEFLKKFNFINKENPPLTFKESIDTIKNLAPQENILDNVVITLTTIPKEIDVVKYFEIMNNRGEQLQKHQIIKAKFLEVLKDDQEYNYAKIWDYCSQMNIVIDNIIYYNDIENTKKSENKIEDIRNNLLNYNYQNYFKYEEKSEAGWKSINDLLQEENSQKEIYAPKEYISIIKFPIFLIHTLKTFLASKKRNFTHIITNDRYLIEYFSKENNLIFDKEEAKEFLLHMLKLRILFDYFIIKRDENGNPLIIKRDDNSNPLQLIREKELIMIELLFNFTSPQYFAQDWISVVLAYLDKNHTITIEELEKFDRELAKIRLSKKGIIEFINEKIENIYQNKNSSIIPSKKLEEILNQGTSTPHYWFYKLDYLLWKNYNHNKVIWKNVQLLKDANINTFRLTRLNSIEHIQPQHPEQNCNHWNNKECSIDNFGNLALISNHMNSTLSNQCFKYKIEDIKKQLKKDTIESLKMVLIYSKYKEWNEKNCKEHYEQMAKLLHEDLKD